MRALTFAAVAAMFASAASADSIKGEYLEARNADVWTGPCFSNSEMNIVGNKAVLAWKVTSGVFEDVKLDGLGVAAVVIGDGTFGIGNKVKTRSVILVDERASETARRALVTLAKTLGGETIQEIASIRPVAFTMSTAYCNGMGCASLDAGPAKIKTRCMKGTDVICHNESLAYPALAEAKDYYAAYSLENEYSGKDLGETFKDSNARSALIGTFSR